MGKHTVNLGAGISDLSIVEYFRNNTMPPEIAAGIARLNTKNLLKSENLAETEQRAEAHQPDAEPRDALESIDDRNDKNDKRHC